MTRHGRSALLLALLFMLGGVARTPAQESAPVPEPYDPEEFSTSLRDLRRAEIVALGSYPFTLLFTVVVYDYARWAGLGFDTEQAPFRRGLDEDPFDDDEKVAIALAAAGVAVGIAVADYLLGRAVEHEPPELAPAPVSSATAIPVPYTGVLPPSLATLAGAVTR